MNNTTVDSFLAEGCGRCDHFQTPACKVHLWTAALAALRELVVESGLVEEMKWGFPTYTLGGHNLVMIIASRESCGLSFLEGAALSDRSGLLELAGPNSRIARLLRVRSVAEVEQHRQAIAELLRQAIALEHAGVRVPRGGVEEPLPEELEARLAADPALAAAFEALTPGRRRSHVLYVTGAKASETRARRTEQCAAKILAGLGWHERG